MGVKSFLKGLVKSTEQVNQLTTNVQKEDIDAGVEPVMEQQMFTKVNDLRKEYIGEEVVISSSNLSEDQAPKWKVEREYKGYMVLTNDEEDAKDIEEQIDKGYFHGLYPVAVYNKLFKKVIVDSPDDAQLSADDVEFEIIRAKALKQHIVDKPSTTYVIPGKLPNKDIDAND